MAHPLTHARQYLQGDLSIWVIPLRQDNYTYFISRSNESTGWIVDPSEDIPLIAFLESKKLTPTHVFLTHHHVDHIYGATALKAHYQAKIIGAASERARLPALDLEFSDTDSLKVDTFDIQIIPCPGHTFHHVSLFLPEEKILFCGDVLFGLGCGRVFEGTLPEMHQTLAGLRALETPDHDVAVFCGHEYTRSNLKVWQKLEVLKSGDEIVRQLETSTDACTIPLSLKNEIRWNPLLCGDLDI